MGVRLIEGDCLEVLRTLPDASVDAVVTDPPYPEIDREYGRMTEADWWDMMMVVCREVRRILKPVGSAVFILQPNSRKVGSMRGWFFDFLAWVCREWNMVQDVWWWNYSKQPTKHCDRRIGLMRPSVKGCVWAGRSDCYRNQESVLLPVSEATVRKRTNNNNEPDPQPSSKGAGGAMRKQRCALASLERGGTTPFNMIQVPNSNSRTSAGSHGHGAGTPLPLTLWWVKYICPPGGTVLDPFAGSGTTGIAAMREGCNAILIENNSAYCDIIRRRLAEEEAKTPLFAEGRAAWA